MSSIAARTPSMLQAPPRLEALRETRLLDSPPEDAFDRLTDLATRILKVPVALVSLVDADRQFFKSACGLPEPWASERQTPLSHSFCQHAVATGEPLIIEDAREHPLVRENLAIRDLEVIAYAGIPLVTSDGQVLGSFCAIDSQPRQWRPEEIDILKGLAASAMVEIELRRAIVQREHAYERLRAESTTDELTGLHNRRGFGILAEHAWSLAQRTGWDLLLLYIDLDDFKQINDTFGHAEGDRALSDAAQLLRRTYRQTDIVARMQGDAGVLARLGGDEFVILALDVAREGEEILALRLSQELERFHAETPRPYRLSLSVGALKVRPDTGTSLETALQEADRRMYKQKEARKQPRK